MRTKASSKNAIISLLFYVINSIFSFISKTIFIRYLGIEYAGLNSLFTNLLGVLNIAELGVGTAVGYSLYKPIAENDSRTVNEILKLYKYLYRIIAIAILVLGLGLTFFLPLIINSSIDMTSIKIYFVLYLFSTVVSYLFTFLNVLPAADQKNYMVVQIQGCFRIVKTIIQLIVIIIFKNYYIWLLIEIFGNVFSYVYTNYLIRKKYGYYEEIKDVSFKKLMNKYKEIIKKVKDLFFHKIGSLVVNQTDNIVISAFCTLESVGIYGNYIAIFNLLAGSIEQMFSGITSSIGNLIVENGKKEAYKIWSEIHVLTLYLALICSFLFYKLANYFVSIWIGEEFLLPKITVFAISLNIGLKIIKQPIDKFKDAFGIFWDKQAPFVEAMINLIVSIVLAVNYGILGVVIGTVVSNIIIILFWKPYIVFKSGFNEEIKNYIILNIPLLILSIITVFISNLIINLLALELQYKFLNFLLVAIIYSVITIIISFIVFMTNFIFRKTLKKYLKMFQKILS